MPDVAALVEPTSGPIVYTREDWTEFRDPARISNRAGVKWEKMPHVLVKELVDNGFDTGAGVRFGPLHAGDGEFALFVEDYGPGMEGTDEAIARRFSIRRPLASSKTIRMPTRGVLGNGL